MKRTHIENAAYFITTNPDHRYPFFDEDTLSDVFIFSLTEAVRLKDSTLLGYKVNPDHIHLIIQVKSEFNISQIMQAVKRISSLRINQILSFGREENLHENLKWSHELVEFRNRFLTKFKSNLHPYPSFKWQQGFYDKTIRTPTELERAFNYLRYQHIKHKLSRNKWMYIVDQIPLDIKYVL